MPSLRLTLLTVPNETQFKAGLADVSSEFARFRLGVLGDEKEGNGTPFHRRVRSSGQKVILKHGCRDVRRPRRVADSAVHPWQIRESQAV